MTTYVGANGVRFTDEDVMRWADEAEAGFPSSDLSGEIPHWRKTEPMVTKSLRVPNSLWSAVEKKG